MTSALFDISDYQPSGSDHVLPADTYAKDPLHGWIHGNHPDFTPEQHDALQEMLVANKSSFAYAMTDLEGYKGEIPPFAFDLTTDQPIFTKARRHSPLEHKVVQEKCAEMLAADVITPCPTTKYASATTLPAKKDADGNLTDRRFCVDFRPLNIHTVADKYQMHLPEELFQQVGDSTIFSKVDLRAGFHQFPVQERCRPMTAFWWGNKLHMYNRLPFGCKNASAHCQKVMDYEIQKAGLQHCALCFVDDILIYSKTPEQHIKDVEAVLRMLKSCGLRAHPDKSVFGGALIEFLGFNIGRFGLSPHAAKTAAIRALPAPTNISELRQVLGFMNYYRVFVPMFSAIARPMTALLTKQSQEANPVLPWGEEQQSAFEKLKEELCTEGRAIKRVNPDKPLLLYTDWSRRGIGAVLSQKDDDGQEYICMAISRSLNAAEAKYSSWQGEMLAAVWSIKHFRHYLHGRKFTVITDHKPLVWLMTNPNLTGHHARWALALQEFDFTIEHRPGAMHQNADILSRFHRSRRRTSLEHAWTQAVMLYALSRT